MAMNAVGASVGVPGITPNRGLGSLKSEDFFKILVTEMQQQDPFEPTKTSDMISQVSQIRSIELSGKLTDTLDQLTRQQRVSGASELIGKFVQAISVGSDGTQTLHEGVVTSIRFNADGSAVLELDTGEAVPATDVVRVTTLDALAPLDSETGGDEETDGESDGE
jgi:flagellar basal-body rod modification protein FlgD